MVSSTCTWKTLRVLSVGGEYFLLQQRYRHITEKEKERNMGGDSHISISTDLVPIDKHRMVPLVQAVENPEEVVEFVSASKGLNGFGDI